MATTSHPMTSAIVVDADTVRIGGSAFVRERTCHDTWDTELTGRLRFQCSICGAVSLEITPMYCPNCGAKVVEQ